MKPKRQEWFIDTIVRGFSGLRGIEDAIYMCHSMLKMYGTHIQRNYLLLKLQ